MEVTTLSQNVVEGTEYVVTRITVAPGAGTGWHYHPGEVFGYISQGAMTHYDGRCAVDAVYPTGGIGPLVMEVVYVNPVGAPKSVEVPEPAGCPIS